MGGGMWHFGADPYHWLKDPDPDPVPTPDPSPFFIDFKIAKIKYNFHIFSYNLPTGTATSVKDFVLKLYFAGTISVRSTHLWEKGRILSRIRTSD